MDPSESHIEDPGKQARAAAGIPVVPVFDGYRAFAILGVIMLHLTIVSGVVLVPDDGILSRLTWATFGRSVEVLFVVSGFVVFLPTVARAGEFGSWGFYAIRRGARLLPAYWMILILSLVLLAFGGLGSDFGFPTLGNIAANFTGTEVPLALVSDDVSVGFGANPPLWTLSIELSFYLVLPFIAVAYYRHPWIGLAIAAAISVLWDVAFSNLFQVADFFGFHPSFERGVSLLINSGAQFPVWAFSFALGMTGAWVLMRIRSVERSRGYRQKILAVLVISVVATVVLAWLNGGNFNLTRESQWLSMAFSLALATAMVTLSAAPAKLQIPFAAGPVRRLGDISYGIYLAHYLFILFLGDQLLSLPTDGSWGALLQWMALILSTSVLYGYLSARFLEQPIRRWARRFGNRREA